MGALISYSFRGMPAEDRRYGPLASKLTLDTRNRRPVINAAFVDVDAMTGVALVMGRG
jgi:hypothetical protein